MIKKRFLDKKGESNTQTKLLMVFILVVVVAVFLTQFAFSSNSENKVITAIESLENSIENNNIEEPLKVNISGSLDSDGALNVDIQNKHTATFDVFFFQEIQDRTTLLNDGVENSYIVNITPGHGIVVGNQLEIFNLNISRVYIGEVIGVSVNTITLDTPLNTNYSIITSEVIISTKDLNVDGSTTRQVFKIFPPTDIKVDVTRLLFQIITDTAPDFNKFGDISGGLNRGVVLRVVGEEKTTNLFNVKTNAELVNLMYDVTFFDTSNPGQGVYGLGGRFTYAGQEKHGVALRLVQNLSLELIIQDDLTSLHSFRMLVSGHVV